MCWIGSRKDKYIAEEDVIVYKAVYKESNEGRFFSPLMGFEYIPNKVYSSGKLNPETISPIVLDKVEIHEGLHSFTTNVLKYARELSKNTLYIGGFHFVIRTSPLYFNGGKAQINCIEGDIKLVILKCIIPKGTVFYKNLHEVVSEKLIVTDEEVIDVDELK